MTEATELMADFASTITVMRFTAPHTFVEGRAVDDTPTTLSLKGVVLPLSGRELLSLPEGQRTREIYKLYSDQLLLAGDEASGQKPDQVVWNGLTFQIQAVENWLSIFGFYKARIVRVQQ